MKLSRQLPKQSLLILLASLLFCGVSPLHAEDSGQSVDPPAVTAEPSGMVMPGDGHDHQAYVCPMHPQVMSDEPGSCPICGMDLVAKQPAQQETDQEPPPIHKHPTDHEHPADQARHTTAYVCPMHPQVMSDEPGNCPICGMDLVVKQPVLQETDQEPPPIHKHTTTRYVCPMHPQVMSDEPGNCPICGMDLVVKKAREGMSHDHSHSSAHRPMRMSRGPTISVPSAVVNQLGVRTAPVQQGTLQREIEGFGVFLRTTVQGYRPLLHGPISKAKDHGASTSALLVQGQVFERQAPLLRIGQTVRVHVPGLGTKEWEGKLIGLEAQVNQNTHTQVFHVSVAPEAASVPPGMNANLVVEVEPIRNVLLVPREAVIVTGKGARVIVDLGGGRFQQRRIDAEDFGEDRIVVHSGLHQGEQVVTSAQFMLDSEANLQAGLQRLSTDSEQQMNMPRESRQ